MGFARGSGRRRVIGHGCQRHDTTCEYVPIDSKADSISLLALIVNIDRCVVQSTVNSSAVLWAVSNRTSLSSFGSTPNAWCGPTTDRGTRSWSPGRFRGRTSCRSHGRRRTWNITGRVGWHKTWNVTGLITGNNAWHDGWGEAWNITWNIGWLNAWLGGWLITGNDAGHQTRRFAGYNRWSRRRLHGRLSRWLP